MFYTSCFVHYREDRHAWYGILRWQENGRRKQKTKQLTAMTARAAEKELSEWHRKEEEIASRRQDLTTATVAVYFENWLTYLKDIDVLESSTLNTYRDVATRIISYLGDYRLVDLTSKQIQLWEAQMKADGYSTVTILGAHRQLKQLLNYALENADIAQNPMVRMRAPKKIARRPNYLDRDGRDRLTDYLTQAHHTNLTIAVYLALYTGMRRGEVCGLRWGDVDFQHNVIWVKQAIGTGRGGTYIKATKTDKVRDIPIPPTLSVILRQWKHAYMDQCDEFDIPWSKQLYVTGDVDSSYYNPHTLTKEWKALAKMLNLIGSEGRRVTYHDLRHTYATATLIDGGVDVKTVSSILGHADATMTLNVYASSDGKAKQAALDRIEEAI